MRRALYLVKKNNVYLILEFNILYKLLIEMKNKYTFKEVNSRNLRFCSAKLNSTKCLSLETISFYKKCNAF